MSTEMLTVIGLILILIITMAVLFSIQSEKEFQRTVANLEEEMDGEIEDGEYEEVPLNRLKKKGKA